MQDFQELASKICMAAFKEEPPEHADFDDQQRFKPDVLPIVRTNGDRIRQMTNDELARFIYLQQMHQQLTGTVEAVETILKALESEVPHE